MKTEDFYKLSREERAVLVANDVIAQLKAKKYIALNGSYITYRKNSGRTEGQIKDEFDNIFCKVCALGATLSQEECVKCHDFYTNFNDSCDEDDYEDSDDEGSSDSENRLLAIMQNIIDNKGNFVL